MAEHASSSVAMYVEVNSERYPLKLGQIYMFGKDLGVGESCQELKISINDQEVDEKHCCLGDSMEEGAYIFDLYSKSGTYLNGNRLLPLVKAFVKHGDVMRLGATQTVKFHQERMETSHDSSGYGDNNRNTSDIIGSSPESTSQRESRLKRFNSHSSNHSGSDNNKFLVPAVPAATKSANNSLIDHSFMVPETEAMSNSRFSLGLNSSNHSRRSDSFTIPETQLCKPRTSTSSNLSIADSDTDENRTKSGFNLNAFGADGDDDDFCIPETQDVLPSSQMPRSLKLGNAAMNGLNILEEKSVDLNDTDENNPAEGSQFRICTQDFNEGFGEENNESMLHSQIIPFIKHTTVLLNGSNEKCTSSKTPQPNIDGIEQNIDEEDKELASIDWNSLDKEIEEHSKIITSAASTPDLFDFAALDQAKTGEEDDNKNDNLFEADNPHAMEDAEDYLATQLFPSSSNNKKTKPTNDKDILSGKEDEHFLTLSDKENMHPGRLEPVTDLPPSQLFAPNDVPTQSPSTSISTQKNVSDKPDANHNFTAPLLISTSKASNGNDTNSVLPQAPMDEEDDILTQAFLQPQKPATTKSKVPMDEEDDILTQAFQMPFKPTTTNAKILPNNCFNSTLLDDKSLDRNPVSFFAEMERTPKKAETTSKLADVFKMPEIGLSNLKKTSSGASTASNATMCSESDMDLLMCTPQLIKELEFLKPDDLKNRMLAATNKQLFGDDTDEGEDTGDERSSKDTCLVQLLNVPKDSKDFDKLLPHLNKEEYHSKRKCSATDGQKAANEAYKVYKFNTCFGPEQARQSKSTVGSSTLSRDERHSARDRERELASQKDKKRNSTVSEDKQQQKNAKQSTRTTRHEEANKVATTKPAKEHRSTRHQVEEEELVNTRRTEGKESSDKGEELPKVPSQKKEKSHNKKKEDNKAKEVKKSKTKNKGTNHTDGIEIKLDKEGKSTFKDREENTENNKEEERPRRGRKRVLSKDSKESEKKVPKTTDSETKTSNSRITRLKSVTEEKLKAAKSTASSVGADEMDLLPTQPLKRSSRTRTTSNQKDSYDDVSSNASSSTAVSRSSSTSRSLNRSSSRLNVSNNAFINESIAKTVPNKSTSASLAAAERKRKADVPAPLQPSNDEKRKKRTVISQDLAVSSATSSKTPLISMTMVDPLQFKELITKSNGLWAVAKDPADSNVLVMDKAFRTFKFLLAMARGIPIVTSKWLVQINTTKSLTKAPLKDYLFSDPVFEKRHKFCLKKSLQLAADNKRLFGGYEFVMTANIQPKPEEIKAIIEFAGGTVHMQGPSPAKDNQKIYLVSSTDDRKDWHKFRRLNKNIITITTEAIMTSVMRHSCSPMSHHILS